MRLYTTVLFLVCCTFSFSCKSGKRSNLKDELRTWIIDHDTDIMKDLESVRLAYRETDSAAKSYLNTLMPDSINRFVVVNTIHANNFLGSIARKAGNSNECIVLTMAFYANPNRKPIIEIAAADSTCLQVVKNINLELDSTNNFIFRKNEKPLY